MRSFIRSAFRSHGAALPGSIDPGSAKRVYCTRCTALPMYRLLRSPGTGAVLVAAGFFGVAGAMTGLVDLCVGPAPGVSVLRFIEDSLRRFRQLAVVRIGVARCAREATADILAAECDVLPLRGQADRVDRILRHGLHAGRLGDRYQLLIARDEQPLAVVLGPGIDELRLNGRRADLLVQAEFHRPGLVRVQRHRELRLLADSRGVRFRRGRATEAERDGLHFHLALVVCDAAGRQLCPPAGHTIFAGTSPSRENHAWPVVGANAFAV